MPLMKLPVRSTLLKTAGGVVMISPIDFSSVQLKKIQEFGEVTAIVAPSLIHHLYVDKAIQNFPQAALWGVPGFENKRADIHWRKILTRDAWPFSPEIETLCLNGTTTNEAVFLDKESNSLVVTDLCFNLQSPQGIGAFIVLHLFGTYKKFGVSRGLTHFISDKKAFKLSVQQLLEWNFDNIIMAHGDVVTGNGKEILTKSLAERGWLN